MLSRTEHDEQAALIDWRDKACGYEPRLSLLFAITNGAKLPFKLDDHGRRYSPEAQRLLAEGLTPGVPDLFLPVACRGYHGLFIEMKSETGVVKPHQKEFIRRLVEQGYHVEVCYSTDEAIKVVSDYLGMQVL